MLPTGVKYRFGLKPRKPADFLLLKVFWEVIDKATLRPVYRRLGEDSYDNCLAYLDERLNDLFEDLQSRGVLDRTLVIITADHGEGIGEHGLFDHGESLYRPEIHVPLVILLPAEQRATGVVRETVSLRNLPATILDLAGLERGLAVPGPIAGGPLASRFSRGSDRHRCGHLRAAQTQSVRSQSWPFARRRGPLVSVAEDDVRLHPQPGGRERRAVQRAGRPGRGAGPQPCRSHAARSGSSASPAQPDDTV